MIVNTLFYSCSVYLRLYEPYTRDNTGNILYTKLPWLKV